VSTSEAAHSAMRRPLHLRQTPRRLQQKGARRSKVSKVQFVHRNRVQRHGSTPRTWGTRGTCPTKGGRPCPSPRSATSRRKGSKCSRMPAWNGVFDVMGL